MLKMEVITLDFSVAEIQLYCTLTNNLILPKEVLQHFLFNF